jgi:hypothetical protein
MVNHPWLKYVDALVTFKRFDAQHRVHPTGVMQTVGWLRLVPKYRHLVHGVGN